MKTPPKTATTSIRRKRPIGAFCTDIEGATQRTEDFQELALERHKTYLQETGRYFIRSIPHHERQNYRFGDFWVPGDALWAVFYPVPSKSKAESVIISMRRLIASVAYGLASVSTLGSDKTKQLSIRGVILAGTVLKVPIFKDFTLYGGAALNACGRLEKKAHPNTIIAGFVIPEGELGNEQLFDSKARCPSVNVNEFRQYLNRLKGPPNRGCKIDVDVVSDNGRELLHFSGWRKREDLRGLDKCNVVTTAIRLTPTGEQGFFVNPIPKGTWERKEASIRPKDDGTCCWELYELLKDSGSDTLDFLKRIYNKDQVKFVVSDNGPFQLSFSGDRCRPRVLRNDVTYEVDFNQHRHCTLATNNDRESRGDVTLIQAYRKNGKRVLSFSKVPPQRLNEYDDFSDYLNSSYPCIEFAFP
jgi:hypothetical protein